MQRLRLRAGREQQRRRCTSARGGRGEQGTTAPAGGSTAENHQPVDAVANSLIEYGFHERSHSLRIGLREARKPVRTIPTLMQYSQPSRERWLRDHDLHVALVLLPVATASPRCHDRRVTPVLLHHTAWWPAPLSFSERPYKDLWMVQSSNLTGSRT